MRDLSALHSGQQCSAVLYGVQTPPDDIITRRFFYVENTRWAAPGSRIEL
jgi:hypothetical protein